MKKTILTFMCIAVFAVACHMGRGVENRPAPGDAEMTKARTRFPDVSMAQLKEGHGLYYGPCTRCHHPKDVSGFSEKKLGRVLDRMAKKAKISDAEKESVFRYLVTTQIEK